MAEPAEATPVSTLAGTRSASAAYAPRPANLAAPSIPSPESTVASLTAIASTPAFPPAAFAAA